jgi:hypothetical protein
MRNSIVYSMLIGLFLFVGYVANAQTARLQVIHNAADPAAASVDVYLNGGLALEGFAFRAATPYIGSVEDTLANFVVQFADGGTYLAIANGVLDPGSFASNPEGLDIAFTLFAKGDAREASTESEEVQFFVFHGATDAPAVDVLARGVGKIVDGAPYGAMTGYLSVPAASYILDITPAGANETIVATFEADLSGLAGGAAAVLASGFLSPGDNQDGAAFGLIAVLPDGTVVELPVYEPMARLQVIHNAADPAAASVDVYLNGGLALEGFAFRAATPYIDVPAGVDINVGIAPANSSSVEDTLANFVVQFADGGTYLAIANGVLDPGSFASNPEGLDIAFTLFAKGDAREVSTSESEVQFLIVHGSTDAPAVDIVARNVATLVSGAAYGDITDYIGVPAGSYTIDIKPAGQDDIVASFGADLSGLGGGTATILASGFLSPGDNQNGASFTLIAVLADGTVISVPTGVEQLVRDIPDSYTLSQNYPNPFNPTTTIRFSLPKESSVRLDIYNMLGQRVATLIDNEQYSAGVYNLVWDARDAMGRPCLQRNVYLSVTGRRIQADDDHDDAEIRKIIRLTQSHLIICS